MQDAAPADRRTLAPIGRGAANHDPPAEAVDPAPQELRLEALIDSSPLALVEFALDTRIRLWNPAAERIFGWTRAEMLGRADLPDGAAAPPGGGRGPVPPRAAGESVNDLETFRLHKDGRLVPVSIAAAPVREASGRVVGNMVAYTDITERKAQAAEVHRLNAELHVRLEELAASRSRIVAAGDVERRRLERNLHDGAQQRLVSLALSLRVALAKLDADPQAARTLLQGAGEELSLALDELRELARGLHPAVLSDHGLRAAVEMLAGRAPVPVEIDAVPEARLPEPVEAAAYYLIAEALTNVAKYARAATVRVRVVARDGRLEVEVADDGAGGADPAAGSGLRGLADRVEALGGTLEIVSPAGAGTTLRAAIPYARSAPPTADVDRRRYADRATEQGRRLAVLAVAVQPPGTRDGGRDRGGDEAGDHPAEARHEVQDLGDETLGGLHPGVGDGAARHELQARVREHLAHAFLVGHLVEVDLVDALQEQGIADGDRRLLAELSAGSRRAGQDADAACDAQHETERFVASLCERRSAVVATAERRWA